SNRVKEMQVNGEVFSGVDVGEKLDLRSTDFTIVQQAGEYMFTTKGFGHGVGMSQYGANGMALEGKTYKDILHYYYQQVEIGNVRDLPDETLLTFQVK